MMAKQRIFYGLDYYDMPLERRPLVCSFGVYDTETGNVHTLYYTRSGRPLMCFQRGAADFELIATGGARVAPSKQSMRKRLNVMCDKGAEIETSMMYCVEWYEYDDGRVGERLGERWFTDGEYAQALQFARDSKTDELRLIVIETTGAPDDKGRVIFDI